MTSSSSFIRQLEVFLVNKTGEKTDLPQKMWNTLKNYIKIYRKVNREAKKMLNDRYKSNAKSTTKAAQQSSK